MDCIIAAGGIPRPGDPLYAYTLGQPRALLDMAGRPMVARVIDALQESSAIDEIIIIGIEGLPGVTLARSVHFLPDQGSLVANVLAGVDWVRERNPAAKTSLVSSADIPLISAEIIDDFIERSRPFDHAIYYNMVRREVLEGSFPNSQRTFTRLRELYVAGGDLILVQPDVADGRQELWQALINARKHAWQLARIVGLRTLIKLLLHRLSLTDVEQLACRMVGRPVKIMLNPNPEIAMDGDKPAQIEMLRAKLSAK